MKKTTWVAIALMLSCMAPGSVAAEVKPYKVSNYPSHDSSFFGELVSGRVWVFENPELKGYANVPHAVLFEASGRRIRCIGHKTGGGKLHWVESEPGRWEVDNKFEASLVNVYKQKKPRFTFLFYDPKTGTLANELASHGKDGGVTWTRPDAGWVQDSWPRLFADGCPGIELPAGMAVNEKQTSSRLRDLREQDPDAVIRNFPGSEMTGPGRIGIAASGVPTTTKDAVWKFLNQQEGNVMRGPQGHGRVFVRGEEGSKQHEVWGLKDEGDIAWIADLVEYEESGDEWLSWKFKGKVVARYRMGDPLPYLPTGHRHSAWQLTGGLVAVPKPTALRFMGEAYADRRFVFYGTGKLAVVDLAGDLLVEGTWRWTKGRLAVAVDGDRAGPRSVGWREFANQLGIKPKVWTRSTPNTR